MLHHILEIFLPPKAGVYPTMNFFPFAADIDPVGLDGIINFIPYVGQDRNTELVLHKHAVRVVLPGTY